MIGWVLDNTALREIAITAELRAHPIVRYTREGVSPYVVALSLTRNAYVSHAAAARLHKLMDASDPIYVNAEQTPKPQPKSSPSQESVRRAFATKQRISRNTYRWAGGAAVIINGKFTNALGVTTIITPDGTTVRATTLERTLIDIAVRPAYGGGPQTVLAAYKKAHGQIDCAVLNSTLEKLSYAYPYHQVVGFYLERSGHSSGELEVFRRKDQRIDFYLDYAMRTPLYDPGWRLYYPRDL
jgi:hypothetical protein